VGGLVSGICWVGGGFIAAALFFVAAAMGLGLVQDGCWEAGGRVDVFLYFVQAGIYLSQDV
jgi:hypothetical protein